jgi:hypothetical protein
MKIEDKVKIAEETGVIKDIKHLFGKAMCQVNGKWYNEEQLEYV